MDGNAIKSEHLMDLGKRPSAYQMWDLTHTTAAINKAAPDAPVRYMRAPGGNFTAQLVDLIRQYEMTPLFWNVDPRDWAQPGVRTIEQQVLAQVRPGSIVISHDGGVSFVANRDGEVVFWEQSVSP